MIDSAIARIFIEKWNKSSSKKKKRKINPHHFIAVHLTTNKIPKHIIPFDQQDYRILFNSVRHVKEKHLETFFFSKVRIKKNKITWSKECIICCTIKDRMVFKNYDIFHWRKPYKKAKNDHFKIFGFVT